MNDIPTNHVIVKFGSGIPSDAQAKAMFDMEFKLRELGIPAEVFKEKMGDDSKLRKLMTVEERAKL